MSFSFTRISFFEYQLKSSAIWLLILCVPHDNLPQDTRVFYIACIDVRIYLCISVFLDVSLNSHNLKTDRLN